MDEVKIDEVNTLEHLLLTTAEAVALVKRAEREKGTKFYVLLAFDAAVEGKKDIIFPSGCCTSLRLSRADALELAGKMLSPTMEAKGGRIRIDKRTSVNQVTGTRIAYWFV